MKTYESFDDFAYEMAEKIDGNFSAEMSEEEENNILVGICQEYGFENPIDWEY